MHFATKLAPLLDHPNRALTSLQPYLGTADFSMVNLETSITTRGTAQPKQFHFRAPPAAFEAVAVGRHRRGDDGQQPCGGLRPGRAPGHAERDGAQPDPGVGIGADERSAYGAKYVDLRGTRVALLAATQVPDWTASHFAASGGRREWRWP